MMAKKYTDAALHLAAVKDWIAGGGFGPRPELKLHTCSEHEPEKDMDGCDFQGSPCPACEVEYDELADAGTCLVCHDAQLVTTRDGTSMCNACAEKYDTDLTAEGEAIAARVAAIIGSSQPVNRPLDVLPGCESLESVQALGALLTRTEIEDRCCLISRELLGFDPRENESPELRSVNIRLLLNALVLTYHAGMKG